jgi:GNAT superfamily N-acetyltransferase
MTGIKMAGPDDIEKLLPALRELRPSRTEDQLRELLPRLFLENYRIVYVGDDLAYSLLGFRSQTTLFSGKLLYVDDLVTLPQYRGKGYAGALFQWAKEFAKKERFDSIALASGPQRHDAHRFYLNQGLVIDAYRFWQKVDNL